MYKCFARWLAHAWTFFFSFSEKLGINPKFLDSHQFHSCCCTGFQTLLLFFDAKEQKRAFTSARLSARKILAKTLNYPQDRNCLACCWQKSSFCSSALHSSFSNLAPPSFPSLSLQYILFFGLNFSPFTNQNWLGFQNCPLKWEHLSKVISSCDL